MKSMLYRCPYCNTEFEVDEENFIDDNVSCPNPDCGRPIRLEPAPAEPVPPEEASRSAHSQARHLEVEVPSTEADLVEVHPAMFRNHPLQYIGLCLLLTVGVTLAIGSFYYNSWLMFGFGVFGAIFALGAFGLWLLQVYFTTLTVTTKRTVLRKGIISRHTNEVSHDDVRNIQVDQSILQRLFGVGQIAVSSSGQSGLEIVVSGIPKPDEVAETIRRGV